MPGEECHCEDTEYVASGWGHGRYCKRHGYFFIDEFGRRVPVRQRDEEDDDAG